MQLGPWIGLAVVGIMPLLVTSDTGRSWLVRGRYSARVWAFLATLALGGLISALSVFRDSVRIGTAVLVATPLLQALMFVAADKLFQLVVGRVPVSFDESRHGRTTGGGRHWSDVSFWALTWLGLIVGAVFLCAHLGVEFPSRGGR